MDIKFDEEEVNHIDKHKDSEKDYLIEALNSGEPEILAHIKYKAIGKKQADGKELTKEESVFMEEMNKLYALEQQKLNAQAQIQAEAEEMKKQVMKEYEETKKTNPEKIDKVDDSKTLRGGESIPKLLKFAFQMKKAKKKGGKVLVKVTRDRKVIIEWSLKDLHFVEFYTKDEKGNLIPEVTRFNEYKYNYEGSPIPVLFAIQGYAEGFDFFDEFRQDITSEMVSRISSRSFHAGYLEGIDLREKQKPKNMLENLAPLTPIILIGGFLVMGWILYQMYAEIQTMTAVVEAFRTTAQNIPAGALVVQ